MVKHKHLSKFNLQRPSCFFRKKRRKNQPATTVSLVTNVNGFSIHQQRLFIPARLVLSTENTYAAASINQFKSIGYAYVN